MTRFSYGIIASFMMMGTTLPTALAVEMYPGADKRKAYPLPNGVGSASLHIGAIKGWWVSSSRIAGRDKDTMWKRLSKTEYELSNAYAPQEFVIVHGTLSNGSSGRFPPEFNITVPGIDIGWDASCGEASQEDREDSVAAALMVTADKSKHRQINVSPAKDKANWRNVMLTWDNPGSVRVWRDRLDGTSVEISNGAHLSPVDTGSFRVEPVNVSNNEITFTVRGEGDDYGGDKVEDHAKAKTYDIRLTNVKFNYDTGSSTTDGINLRGSYVEDFDIANGEWTVQDGAVAPICYKVGQPIKVKARFSTTATWLTSATISAANAVGGGAMHCFGSFGAKTVSFSGGVSDYVEFEMNGAAPSAISMFDDENINWLVSAVNGQSMTATVITNSGPHRVYVVLDEPRFPWSSLYEIEGGSNPMNAWTNALDFAIVKAGCIGDSSPQAALSHITQYLFNGHGVQYDVTNARASYSRRLGLILYHSLTEYMGKSQGCVVNCIDQASAVTALGSLLGIETECCGMSPFGYLNTVNLVGVGNCNNPLYMSADCTNHNQIVDYDSTSPNRTKFGLHLFSSCAGKVFDACLGPESGSRTKAQYIADIIDTSTAAEEAEAGDITSISSMTLISVL